MFLNQCWEANRTKASVSELASVSALVSVSELVSALGLASVSELVLALGLASVLVCRFRSSSDQDSSRIAHRQLLSSSLTHHRSTCPS